MADLDAWECIFVTLGYDKFIDAEHHKLAAEALERAIRFSLILGWMKPVRRETGEAPPFFVLGPPRSGTTLLLRILESHSRLAVYGESHFYPLLYRDRIRYGDLPERQCLVRLVRDVRRIVAGQGRMQPPTEREFLDALIAPTFEGVLETWLRLYARSVGKPRAGDKTPGHHAFLAEILRGFPSSPVVFVVRDPRDTADSNREAFGSSMESTAHVWRDAVRRCLNASRAVHVVRYEELAGDPETTVRSVCDFLGEEFEERMLTFYEHPHGFIPEELPHHGKLFAPIDDGSVGRHRALPRREIESVEAICAVEMKAIGYEPSGNSHHVAPAPGRRSNLLDRLRFYGTNLDRWRMGRMRWRIVVPLRIRDCASFGWLRRRWRARA